MRLPDMERDESAAYAAETGAGEAGAAGTIPGMTDETGENTTGPSGVSGQGHSGKSRRSGSGKRIAVILGTAAAVVILIVAANLLLGISGGGGIYTGDYDGLAELDEEHIVLDEETGIEYVDNTILVFTQADLTDRQKRSIASSVDGVVIGEYEGMAGLLQIEVESSSLSELDELAADLEENDLVWFSSYDFLLNLVYEDGSDETAEVLEQGDWWEDAINIERTWEEFGDCFGDINIGVIDSAIDTTQSDVSGKIAFPTTSIELRNQANQSDAAHGTAVTALIVADRDGSGVDGIADQAVVYFCSGSGTFSNVSEGIMKLADSGCRVINNSYCIQYEAYDYSETAWAVESAEKIGAISRGMVSAGWDGLFVQSAGNQAINTYEVGLWATYKHAHSDLDDHILIVTGTEENETQTEYQLSEDFAYGEDVDICAPGVGIAVPSNGTYSSNGWGTSFSAPMVTAVAGLIWSADPDMTAAEVKSCLVNGYRFELTSSVSGDTYPMLDAYNAVQRALYCAFEGTVEYEDGTPAEGITVLAVDENGETLNDAVTDENGCYVINCSRLAVDHLSFYVEGEEAETLEIADEYREYDADAAKGDTESGYDPHDMETLVLPLSVLDIYVEDEEGESLSDLTVIATDSGENVYRGEEQEDEEGRVFYEITLPAGEYTLSVSSDENGSLSSDVTVTLGSNTLEYTLSNSLADASVGDIVTFGHYEQDWDTSNGAESIEWLVAAEEGDYILLVSEKLLGVMTYPGTADNWEGSAVRSWLNGEFYEEAFSESEQEVIVTTTVCTLREEKWDSYNGRNTEDKVFILSADELEEYLDSSDWHTSRPTGSEDPTSWYWLRCTGISSEFRICKGGEIIYSGEACTGYDWEENGVRPAMWVSRTGDTSAPIVQGDDEVARMTAVGDIVPFGDLDWIVLDTDEEGLLLISEYVLEDTQDLYTDVWDVSSVRTWLNSTFLDTYFEEEERAKIRTTTVVTEGCSDTEDQVFLLSSDEAREYFYNNEERQATTKDRQSTHVYWQLRSKGTGRFVEVVSNTGGISDGWKAGLRPVIWVNDTGMLAYPVVDDTGEIVEPGSENTEGPAAQEEAEESGESIELEESEHLLISDVPYDKNIVIAPFSEASMNDAISEPLHSLIRLMICLPAHGMYRWQKTGRSWPGLNTILWRTAMRLTNCI